MILQPIKYLYKCSGGIRSFYHTHALRCEQSIGSHLGLVLALQSACWRLLSGTFASRWEGSISESQTILIVTLEAIIEVIEISQKVLIFNLIFF